MDEIERRYLVNLPLFPRMRGGVEQQQGYFNHSAEENPSIRVRVTRKEASVAFKVLETSMVRREIERRISLSEGQYLLATTTHQVVKTRYRHYFHGHLWEIDFYHGENEGLVIAEIELKSEDEGFQHPEWLDEEITDDLLYTATSLAFDPWNQWSRKGLTLLSTQSE